MILANGGPTRLKRRKRTRTIERLHAAMTAAANPAEEAERAARFAARSAAARRAVATMRAKGILPPVKVPEIRAGLRTDYDQLTTSELLALLPGEQAHMERFEAMAQATLARGRITDIEAELDVRGVDNEIQIAARFSLADYEVDDVALAERYAQRHDGEAFDAGHFHFQPEDFAA